MDAVSTMARLSNLNYQTPYSLSTSRRREVPKAGLEPARPCGHCALNAARLPIPPLRQIRWPV